MFKVEYAALKYYNSIISEECLYIGMLFHNLTTGDRDFRYISNFKRFRAFDDEADVSFIKAYLLGIKTQVENNILNYQDSFSIKEFTRVYVNEFKFTDITTIEIDEQEDYVDNLTRMYLKFDFTREKRLSNTEEKKYIKRILSSKNVIFENSKIPGVYNENINFDYIVGGVAIKLFSFREKDATKLIPTAKQWSFSAEELSNRYKVFFLYDNDDHTPQMKIVLQILQKHAEVYQLQEGLSSVLKAIS